jgi:hypothetical protein
MARELDKLLAETLAKFHPAPRSAVWDCRGTWVIRHKDVELMAARAGVRFGLPTVIEASGERKVVAMLVTATLGEVTDWATGEAAPANNKNAYPYAMAEKRARDRVALKVLGFYGLYSDEEADKFKEGRPPDAEEEADEFKEGQPPDAEEPATKRDTPKPVVTSGISTAYMQNLEAAEHDLTEAARRGTAALMTVWRKQLSEPVRVAFGGKCPDRFKELAARHDREAA